MFSATPTGPAMAEPGQDDAAEDRIEHLADEFAARLRNGARVTVDEVVAAHPDLPSRLREVLQTVLAVESLKVRHLAMHPEPRLPSDRRLGDFRIVREVGRGGMAIVYEAVQESLARVVALKVLPQTAFLDDEQVVRFQNEARIVSRLWHPHIVPVHTVGVDAGVHFFAMPLIAGVGLDRVVRAMQESRCRDGAPLDPTVAAVLAHLDRGEPAQPSFWLRLAKIGADFADAIEHAHCHGVIHRDVKPSNLLLEADGKAWVSDFGIAKCLDQERATRTGQMLGTLHYVPPEQFDGIYDARGDVYGLGLSLLELGGGATTWPGGSIPALVEHIRRGVPHTLRQICRGAPRDLSLVLQKATACNPSERYVSAAEFAADLRRFAAGRPILARSASVAARLLFWCRRNRLAAVCAAASVLAIGAASLAGWGAFWVTDRALGAQHAANARARTSLDAARRATHRAEANLELALESYDEVFRQITGGVGFAATKDDASTLPLVSNREHELLQAVLSFYESFASTNADHPRLRRAAAGAFARAGDIRRWNGDPDGARAAYVRAVEFHERVESWARDDAWVLAMASMRAGQALVSDDAFAALADLESVRLLLERRVSADAASELAAELVRLCNTIGVVSLRSSPLASGQVHPYLDWCQRTAVLAHERAVAVAQCLVAADPSALDSVLLLARSLRLLAHARLCGPSPAAASLDNVADSLDLLEAMSRAWPGTLRCRVEWIDACSLAARHGVHGFGCGRLTQSLAEARDLVVLRPGLPEFEELLARVLRRSGEVAASSGQAAAALASFDECGGVLAALWQRFPRAEHHLQELLQVRFAQANVLRDNGDPAQAMLLLEQVLDLAEATRSPTVALGARAIDRELLSLCVELGDDEAAERVRHRAIDRNRGRFGSFRPR